MPTQKKSPEVKYANSSGALGTNKPWPSPAIIASSISQGNVLMPVLPIFAWISDAVDQLKSIFSRGDVDCR